MHKPNEYGVFVRLSLQDGEEIYEAKVAGLQDIKAYGDTYTEAYEGAMEAIAGLQEMYASKGKIFPEPEVQEQDFSGRVTLRMSKSLHRRVHEKAAQDGISLNQWIVEGVGFRLSHFGPKEDTIVVLSPMNQAISTGIYIQFANYVGTRTIPAGSTYKIFSTPNVTEVASQNVSRMLSFQEKVTWLQT